MITALTAIVDGTEYSLSDETLCWLEDYDEVGAAPVERITERGPQQHGDTDVDFRLTARYLALVFGLQGTDLTAKRRSLLRIFKPRLTALKLRWNFDDGSVRQIDGHYAGQLSLGHKERFGLYQRAAVVVRCPDPLWYDPTLHVVTFGLGGGSAAGTVPTAVPTPVGASTINQTRVIPYAGDFRENPLVVINGPVDGPVVEQLTTGEVLDFTGFNLSATDSLIINPRYGQATVVDQAGTDRIDKLSDDSDLTTFHLEADPDAPGGDNEIRVTGSNVTTATEIYLQYYDKFTGW